MGLGANRAASQLTPPGTWQPSRQTEHRVENVVVRIPNGPAITVRRGLWAPRLFADGQPIPSEGPARTWVLETPDGVRHELRLVGSVDLTLLLDGERYPLERPLRRWEIALAVLPMLVAGVAGAYTQSTSFPPVVLRSLAFALALGFVLSIAAALGAVRLARFDAPAGLRATGMIAVDVVVLLAFGVTFASSLTAARPAAGPAFSAAPGVCLRANVTSRGVEAPWNGTPVECATAHEVELIAVIASTSTTYPSADEWQAMSDMNCDRAFLEYVGLPVDLHRGDNIVWYGPSSDEWAAGNHNLICGVYAAPGESLSGSVKGTGG